MQLTKQSSYDGLYQRPQTQWDFLVSTQVLICTCKTLSIRRWHDGQPYPAPIVYLPLWWWVETALHFVLIGRWPSCSYKYVTTWSLGTHWAPTSSYRHFTPLDIAHHVFGTQAVWSAAPIHFRSKRIRECFFTYCENPPPFYTSIVDFGQFWLEFFIMYKIGDDMDSLLLDGSAGQGGSMSGMSTNMW